MKKIFKLSFLIIAAVPFMAVKCGEEEVPRPDSLDPITVTYNEAMTNDSLLELTIKISDNVFFVDPEGTMYNSTGSNAGGSREIKTCDGDGGLVVFTSTDRVFAYQEIPTKMGPIYGILSEYQGTRQLLLRDLNDVSDMTEEKCAEKTITVTVDEFNSGAYEGEVVKIENVQFVLDDQYYGNGKFNGTESNGGGTKYLADCDGNQMVVFTYTDNPLSNEDIPLLRGDIIGEAGKYGSTNQLLLRTKDDYASMVEERCVVGGVCAMTPITTYSSKNFDDNSIASGGWTNFNVAGSTSWTTKDDGTGNTVAYITNRTPSGDGNPTEAWLISPSIDLSSSTNAKLSFINTTALSAEDLSVKISTNYSGSGDPSAATWTDLSSSVSWDTDILNWDRVCSGDVDISSNASANTYVAFIYNASSSTGPVWQIDDILVKE